jgi:hypothetical protein
VGGVVRLDDRWLRHTITVEPYRGASANGPVYGSPVVVPCHLDATSATTRTTSGRSAGDSTIAYCQLDAAAVLTPEARVTVAGRVVEVVSVRRNDYPDSPVPEHLEVTFL